MFRLIKVQSESHGPYTATNRFIRATMSETTTAYNFYDAFLLAECNASTANHQTALKWLNHPLCKLKNVKLMSSKQGQIGYTQHFNILAQNLKLLTEYKEDWNGPLFLNEDGSAWQNEQVKFRLRDLHPFFRTKQAKSMTTEYYGDIHIEIEVEIEAELLEKDLDSAVYAPDVTLGAAGRSSLLVGNTKGDLFAGQRVKVSLTRDRGGNVTQQEIDTVINDIARNATGDYVLTLANQLGNDADDLTNIRVQQRDVGADAITQPQIQSCQVVLYESLSVPKQKTGKVPYTTYTLEMVPLGAVQYFNQQYELEPKTINTIMLTPQNGNFTSVQDHLATYRISLDNEDTTNRDVPIHTGLHYAMLEDGLQRSGFKLVNGGYVAIVQPVKSSMKYTRYQVNLTASQAMTAKTIYLFKEIIVN